MFCNLSDIKTTLCPRCFHPASSHSDNPEERWEYCSDCESLSESQALANLRDDVAADLARSGRIIVGIEPGTNGSGKPDDFLIEITYGCRWETQSCLNLPPHTHGALYGPRVIRWGDNCKNCGESKWALHKGHEYEPYNETLLDVSKYSLYQD